MDVRCARLRQSLPEGHPGHGLDLPVEGSTRSHLAACGPCREWLSRGERRVALLRSLERAAVPAELEVLVSAALGSEGRGARVEQVLRSLGRLPSPVELERALESLAAPGQPGHGLQRAPAVLQRLVSEELADPPKARARRFLWSLERLRPPRGLERALRQELTRPPRRGRAGPWLLIGSSLAAAALLIALRLPLGRPEAPASPDAQAQLRVEPLHSAANLDPMARSLLDAMSGGVLSAESL